MKTRSILSVAAVLLLATLQSGMASTLDTKDPRGRGACCLEIGITIQFDPHQASWNGIISCDEKSGWTVALRDGNGGASTLKPGDGHPRAIVFAKKGAALLRAAFRTSLALAKHWLKERIWFLEIH